MPIKECCERILKDYISPCLYVLVAIQILIGLMVIITSEYFKNLLGRYVPETEQNEINIKIFLFELFGFNVFLSYIGGLPLIRRLTDSYTNHLSSLLKLWQFFIFTASLNGIFGGYMINGSRKFLKKTIEAILFRGIDVYYSDPEWRLIWDGFQYNEQCCGVIDFRDWQSLSWMINEDENAKFQRFEDYAVPKIFNIIDNTNCFSDENLLSLTPYSCCKKNSACYGNTIRENVSQIWIELPLSINMTLINKQGCLKIFSEQLDEMCMIIFFVVSIVFLLQILILISMMVLMHRKSINSKQTLNNQCQTDLPRGVPLLLDGVDSVEFINECDDADDDNEYILHKKTSKHYIVKNYKQRNRVAFSNLSSDEDEQETCKLLNDPTN